MSDDGTGSFPWSLFASEIVGTALLVLVGLSFVILMFGTSTNPARTLGPVLVSGHWEGWWIYWVGPLLGAFAATLAFSFLAHEIEVAKLSHFRSAHHRLARRDAHRVVGK